MKNKQGYETTDLTKDQKHFIEVTLNIDHVISRTFDMNINVTQLETGEIEVKDTAGIRLHLLNKIDDKGLIEKAMTTNKPYYAIGVDTYDKDNLAYCLTRKIGDTIEVLLSKVSREEAEFLQEVDNLAKYFDADVFRSGD